MCYLHDAIDDLSPAPSKSFFNRIKQYLFNSRAGSAFSILLRTTGFSFQHLLPCSYSGLEGL